MDDDERLIPDKQVREMLGGISPMTLWRWERDADLKFPPAVRIKKRKYRVLGEIRQFKARQPQTVGQVAA